MVNKILIIKTGALGDMVIASGPIKRILEHHIKDDIWLLTSSPYKNIFSGYEKINIVAFKRKGFYETFKTIHWIRSKNFTRLYDLQSNDRTAILCFFSGVEERVGNHPRTPYNIHPAEPYNRITPIFYRLHEILDSATVSGDALPPELPVSALDITTVNQFKRQHNLQNGFVVMHAGASKDHPQKCWPYFSLLAERLEQHGHTVLWAGSIDENDNNNRLAESAGINISGLFTVNQLAELGKSAHFAITNDSGPMHILATAGIPVYSFFGPTNWRRHHAFGQEKYVISAKEDSVEFSPLSLDKITVQMVIDRLQKDNMLKNPG